MCWCTPEIRTPCCGKLDCRPKIFNREAGVEIGEYFVETGEPLPEWVGDVVVTVSPAGISLRRSNGAADHQ
jgi:hypothetical protein